MSVQATEEDVRERAAIDRSARFPVLFFFTSAAAWLFVATILGFFSAIKLRNPGLFDGCPLLGYGRIFPMHMTALVYGWALQAGIGVRSTSSAQTAKSRPARRNSQRMRTS